MMAKFEKAKIGKQGKVGGLFFHEVKIEKGFIFYPSSLALIGFIDLEEDETDFQTLLKDTF